MKKILLLLLLVCASYANSQEFEEREVIGNLDTVWELFWGDDDHLWITERYGRISRVNPETGDIQHLITIDDVFEDGERGLMGLFKYTIDGKEYAYTVYTYLRGEDTYIKLVRYEFDGSQLIDPTIIMDDIRGYWNHDGARIWIDSNDETMYLAMGDRAVTQTAQDLDSYNGKILRMNLDGSVPEDNPFKGSHVWSYGHRNPQGLIMHNGILYSAEHGPNTDDELNIIEKGRNYGWPHVNGYCDQPSEMDYCEKNNVVEPILSMSPQRTYAVCGIDFYDHDLIEEWKNSVLVVALKDRMLVQVKLDPTGREVLEENFYFKGKYGRLRDVCVSPDGRVFLGTSNRDGRGSPGATDDRIIEIKPKSTSVEEESRGELRCFPNPADDVINIDFGGGSANSTLSVVNMFGSVVFSKDIREMGSFDWDLTDASGRKLPSGKYFIMLNGHNKMKSSQISIVR
jgi:glucose/arabinose dehydrogenase